MIAFRMRLAAVVVVCSALGGVLSWTAGLWPGVDDPHATVDHCYVAYDGQEVRHTQCVGNWTRGNHGYSGPIYGVDVKESWKVTDVETSNAYGLEATVPESAKQPRVLADGRQAWTISARALPWGLIPAAVAALLVALAWSITATFKARKLGRGALAESVDSTATPA